MLRQNDEKTEERSQTRGRTAYVQARIRTFCWNVLLLANWRRGNTRGMPEVQQPIDEQRGGRCAISSDFRLSNLYRARDTLWSPFRVSLERHSLVRECVCVQARAAAVVMCARSG